MGRFRSVFISFLLCISCANASPMVVTNDGLQAHVVWASSDELTPQFGQVVVETISENQKRLFKGFQRKGRPLKTVFLFHNSSLTIGASWSGAFYSRGTVFVPVTLPLVISRDYLADTIAHEYTHAIIADITGDNCPAWLDEGLAQLQEHTPIIEGSLCESLTPPLVPLADLHDGWMSFSREKASKAYATSLVAARLIIAQHGWNSVLKYFRALRNRTSGAFDDSFGESLPDFEARLHREIGSLCP